MKFTVGLSLGFLGVRVTQQGWAVQPGSGSGLLGESGIRREANVGFGGEDRHLLPCESGYDASWHPHVAFVVDSPRGHSQNGRIASVNRPQTGSGADARWTGQLPAGRLAGCRRVAWQAAERKLPEAQSSASSAISCSLRQRMPASMSPSRSPSKTAEGLLTS